MISTLEKDLKGASYAPVHFNIRLVQKRYYAVPEHPDNSYQMAVSSAIILPYFSKSVSVSLSKANGIFFLKALLSKPPYKSCLVISVKACTLVKSEGAFLLGACKQHYLVAASAFGNIRRILKAGGSIALLSVLGHRYYIFDKCIRVLPVSKIRDYNANA